MSFSLPPGDGDGGVAAHTAYGRHVVQLFATSTVVVGAAVLDAWVVARRFPGRRGRHRYGRAVTTTESTGERTTYVLVDGENIDAVLGVNILGHRPNPDERPRWDRILEYVRGYWDQPVRALFFLNATSGSLPMGFVQALLAMDYRPVPLAGTADVKVVDVGIQRTLDAIAERDADVLLLSHDGDFLENVERLLATEGRRVGLVGFGEYVNSRFAALPGLRVLDLERDVKAFNIPLPRVRIIPLDEFDPAQFL